MTLDNYYLLLFTVYLTAIALVLEFNVRKIERRG
jgi:hypothetical protein